MVKPQADRMPRGAQQHHRHGDGGNQGGAEVLEEQVHHQEDQDDRLHQGLQHLLDGQPDEGGGVVGEHRLDALGEELLQLGETVPHQVGGVQGVGAGGQLDGQAGGGLAVVAGRGLIAFRTDLDARHVPKPDLRAVGVDPQQDGAELFRRFQAALGADRGVERLAGQGGQAADLTRRQLGVLGLQRGGNVGHGEAVAGQLVGVEPDAHGMLGAEHRHFAHAGDAGHVVLDARHQEVGEVAVGQPAVGGENRPTTIRKFLVALATRTPCCCTSWGRRGVARASLFCT